VDGLITALTGRTRTITNVKPDGQGRQQELGVQSRIPSRSSPSGWPGSRSGLQFPASADAVHALGWRELQIVAAKLLAETPAGNNVIMNAMPSVENGG
jgi:hypothetical protein